MAQKEGVSIDQFIASAVAEKVSAIATEEYLLDRAQRAYKAAFESLNPLQQERERKCRQ